MPDVSYENIEVELTMKDLHLVCRVAAASMHHDPELRLRKAFYDALREYATILWEAQAHNERSPGTYDPAMKFHLGSAKQRTDGTVFLDQDTRTGLYVVKGGVVLRDD